MIRTFKQVAKYVYETLGPGHKEAIYRDAMSVELQYRGYTVKTEAPISIRYKTKEDTKEYHQLKKYLEALKIKNGMVINFLFPPEDSPEFIL